MPYSQDFFSDTDDRSHYHKVGRNLNLGAYKEIPKKFRQMSALPLKLGQRQIAPEYVTRLFTQRKIVSDITIQARRCLTMSPCISKFQRYECGAKSALFSNEKSSIELKTYMGTYTNWCVNSEVLFPEEGVFSNSLYINLSSLLECPHFEIDIETRPNETLLSMNLVPRTDIFENPRYVSKFYEKFNDGFYKKLIPYMNQQEIGNMYERVSLMPMGVRLSLVGKHENFVAETLEEFFRLFTENLEISLDDILVFKDQKRMLDVELLEIRDKQLLEMYANVFDMKKTARCFDDRQMRKDVMSIMNKEKSIFID